jgi:hypothetical protein
LDDITATKETVVQLFHRCTGLEELGLKLSPGPGVSLVRFLYASLALFTVLTHSSKHTIGNLVPLVSTFQRLNLVMGLKVSPHHLQEAEAFLSQGMPQLQRINMCPIEKFAGRRWNCIGWEVRFTLSCMYRILIPYKRRWIYDAELCTARRHISMRLVPPDVWRDRT